MKSWIFVTTVLLSLVGVNSAYAGISTCDEHSPNYLEAGDALLPDGCLVSRNGIYIAKFLRRGNIAIYRGNYPQVNKHTNELTFQEGGATDIKMLWEIGKGGENSFAMQGDGNLVLYRGHTPTWSTRTYHSGARFLTLTDVGELVLYTHGVKYGPISKVTKKKQYFSNGANSHFKWASHTWEHMEAAGVYITKIDTKHETISHSKFVPSGVQSSQEQNNCDGMNASTGNLTLAASYTKTNTWGRSYTFEQSASLTVEMSYGAFAASGEITGSRSHTTTRGGSEEKTVEFHSTADYNVPAGYKQKMDILLYQEKKKLPYIGFKMVNIWSVNKGRVVGRPTMYRTLWVVHDVMDIDNSHTSTIVYHKPIKCGS